MPKKLGRGTPIINKIRCLSKYGFRVDYLSGVYSHKGMKGLNQIQSELERTVGKKICRKK